MRRRIGAFVLAVVGMAFAGRLDAQQAEPSIDLTRRPQIFQPLGSSIIESPGAPAQEGTSLVEPKNFWRASAEVVAINTAVWGYNRLNDAFDVTEEGDSIYWSRISPATMLKNLQRGWVWDDNAFINNQFAHPYHGSTYYNAGRSNGYSYWESGAFTIAGSWLWEYLMETHPPAPNDWATTSLGGIALGEMLYRFSSLVLDNRATGSGRTWREIAVVPISPIRAVNRAISGQTGRVSENPADWRTPLLRARFDLGYRRVTDSIQIENEDFRENFVVFGFEIDYGDPHDVDIERPFDFFELRGDLVSNENKPLTSLFVTGMLTRHDFRNTDRSDLRLGVMHRYTYLNSKFLETGNQAFSADFMWRRHLGRSWQLRADLSLQGIVLGAISSEYADVVGRTYDYGPGAGWGLQVTFEKARRQLVRLGYSTWYIHTVNGAEGEHFASILSLQGIVPIFGPLGIGAEVGVVQRNSLYSSFEDTTRRTEYGRVFLSWATR